MTKKQRAIVFMVTADYGFALAAMLVNLRHYAKGCYDDVVIYHTGLPQEQQNALQKIQANLNFVHYDYEAWSKEHIHHSTSKQQQHFLSRFSHLALSKYKLFEQLAYYHSVLFLDLDMLIYGDLSELFALGQAGGGMAWRTEASFVQKFGNRNNRPNYPELDAVPDTHPAPNGGLIYADDRIDWQKALIDGRDFINHFSAYFSSVLDELTLSWIAYKQQVSVTELDHRVYNVLPRVADENSAVVHFMGSDKAWNDELMQLAHPDWLRYYRQAQKFGDFTSDKAKVANAHGQTLRKYANQQRWLGFLNEVKLSYPEQLSMKFDLGGEQLFITASDDVFYSFTLNKNTQDYKLSLHLQNKLLLSDIRILAALRELVANNKDLKLNESAHQLILTTVSSYPVNRIPTIWQYFYTQTWHCLGISSALK